MDEDLVIVQLTAKMIPGFDPTKRQLLVNANGKIRWVEVPEVVHSVEIDPETKEPKPSVRPLL